MNRIRKGDEVVVVAGKDKGRRGVVVQVIAEDNRAIVEGINTAKKHMRPNPQAGIQGGIVDKDMPIDLSNVMLWNPVSKKGDRIGFKTLEDGRKVRFFRSDGEVVDV